MSQTETPNGDGQEERELRFDVSADRFRQFVESVNSLVDEAKLRFDHEGIRVSATDPANVAMVEAELYLTAFQSFEASEGAVGLHVSDIAGLLETVDEHGPEDATIRFELGDSRKFTIKVGRFEWTEGWIDPDHIRRDPDLPELDLPAEMTLPGSDLTRAVKYNRFVKRTGHTFLEVDEDRRELVARCEDDTDEGAYTLAEEDGLRFHEIGPACSRYSNDYLSDLVDGIPEGTDVRLRLGEEFPLRMKFGIDEGQVEYLQAPRIVSD